MLYKKILNYLYLIIIILLIGCTPFNHISEDDFISSNKNDVDNNNNNNNISEWEWYFVDVNGTNGINENPSNNAYYPQLTVYNSNLYATWVENGEIKIAIYNNNDNNPLWSFIDCNISGDKPQLTVFNSKLYLAYDYYLNASLIEIHVAVYNGDKDNPIWTLISNNGLNKNSYSIAEYPQLTVYNSKLYATWVEDFSGAPPNVRVAVYNGDDNNPAWTFVDGGNTYGLNTDPNNFVSCSQLTVFKSKLYIIWDEQNPPTKIHVAVYNGDDNNPAWTFAENNGNDYINKDITMPYGGKHPQLTVYNSELYAIWAEFYKHQNGTNAQVTVAKYNGDDLNPSWKYVDSGDVFGLNKNIKDQVDSVQLTSLNTDNPKLFATWEEGDYNSQIRVAMFNGENNSPMWSFIDGNNAHGINKDYNKVAIAPQLTAFESKLYAIWQENSTKRQIRVAVYKK